MGFGLLLNNNPTRGKGIEATALVPFLLPFNNTWIGLDWLGNRFPNKQTSPNPQNNPCNVPISPIGRSQPGCGAMNKGTYNA